ncbi:MAG: hypothetical protein AB7U98_01460 [Candidatus Nitrosocosmicus sp.]
MNNKKSKEKYPRSKTKEVINAMDDTRYYYYKKENITICINSAYQLLWEQRQKNEIGKDLGD